MNSQLKRGILELIILEYLKNEEKYGYEIVGYLDEYIKVKESSVYIILTRLYQNNYLTMKIKKKGSRDVKYYKVSQEGLEYLKALNKQWDEIQNLVLKTREENNA